MRGGDQPASESRTISRRSRAVGGTLGNDTITLASKKISGTTYYITVPAFLYRGGSGKDVASQHERHLPENCGR